MYFRGVRCLGAMEFWVTLGTTQLGEIRISEHGIRELSDAVVSFSPKYGRLCHSSV